MLPTKSPDRTSTLGIPLKLCKLRPGGRYVAGWHPTPHVPSPEVYLMVSTHVYTALCTQLSSKRHSTWVCPINEHAGANYLENPAWDTAGRGTQVLTTNNSHFPGLTSHTQDDDQRTGLSWGSPLCYFPSYLESHEMQPLSLLPFGLT